MSLGFYPEFNPSQPSSTFACDPDGCCEILSACEELDRFATEAGWKPLSSFADNRPVPEDFEGDPSELDDLQGPWDEWFSPADALPTINGLTGALEENPDDVSETGDVEALLFELRALGDALRAADFAQASFRLTLVE